MLSFYVAVILLYKYDLMVVLDSVLWDYFAVDWSYVVALFEGPLLLILLRR